MLELSSHLSKKLRALDVVLRLIGENILTAAMERNKIYAEKPSILSNIKTAIHEYVLKFGACYVSLLIWNTIGCATVR